MKFLIIESHPYEKSFITSAAAMVHRVLTGNGYTVENINLINDMFDPIMSADELKLWREGKSKDKLVEKYQEMIINAGTLIIPFPVWWGNMPAVLKGFWDKVLLPKWAFGSQSSLLTGKKAIVITAMTSTLASFNKHMQNPVRGALINNTLKFCGIDVCKHFEVDKIDSGREYTEEKMREIEHFFATEKWYDNGEESSDILLCKIPR